MSLLIHKELCSEQGGRNLERDSSCVIVDPQRAVLCLGCTHCLQPVGLEQPSDHFTIPSCDQLISCQK